MQTRTNNVQAAPRSFRAECLSGSAAELNQTRTDVHAGDAADSAKRKDLLTTRFVVSDALALESQDETYVTVVNKTSAARLKLSRAVYRFLLGFDTPRKIEDVMAGGPSSRLLSLVRMLVDKRILVDVDAPSAADAPRLRTAVPYKFCNSPGYVNSATPPYFVVLGVPYDLGGGVDCRLAPTAIREKSFDYTYQVQFDTGRPHGWFDVNRGARILEGATIADAGDVYIEYGENQRDLFRRIGDALEDACTNETVPVILGGDRSVTFAVIEYLQIRRPLTVVQFARVPAIGTAGEAGVVIANEVGRRLLQLRGVDKFVSFGGYDEAMDGAQCPEGVIVKDASSLRQCRPDEVVRLLGSDLAVHLSIDLSVLTAECVKLDETRASQGLTLHEIKELIRALGAAHRIASIDIVGLDMEREALGVSTVIACHLVLTAMSAAYDRF